MQYYSGIRRNEVLSNIDEFCKHCAKNPVTEDHKYMSLL